MEAVLFMKGFHSLVIHWAVRRAWKPATKTSEAGADANMAKGGGGSSGQDVRDRGGHRQDRHRPWHGESIFSCHLDPIFDSSLTIF
jgi:hypothetical protein